MDDTVRFFYRSPELCYCYGMYRRMDGSCARNCRARCRVVSMMSHSVAKRLAARHVTNLRHFEINITAFTLGADGG